MTPSSTRVRIRLSGAAAEAAAALSGSTGLSIGVAVHWLVLEGADVVRGRKVAGGQPPSVAIVGSLSDADQERAYGPVRRARAAAARALAAHTDPVQGADRGVADAAAHAHSVQEVDGA
jgi:hypothetical protein